MSVLMSTENRWLLVDGNSLVTYLWFRSPNNNVASQVWLYIADMMQSYGLEHIGVAWDYVYTKGKTEQAGKCRRRQEYPAYKGNRVGGHPQWMIERPRVLKEVKESLKHLPVKQGTLEELEADDVLWCWTRMVGGLIISGDEDLWQCCNKDVRVWSPRKKEEVGLEHIKEKFGSVKAMMVQKALVGDTSDNIVGVKGIGWSRAKQLWIEKSDKLESILNGVIELHEDDKWMLCVIDQMDVFKRNWKIIKLGEVINENDMMKAETFLMQPVKFDSNDARHFAAYKGWHEIIRKWNPISQAYQQAVPQ
jgi:5'-3' exonuclease